MERTQWETDFKKRTLTVVCCVVLMLALIVGRQVWLQCLDTAFYAKLAQERQKSHLMVTAERGSIRGRHGEVLAATSSRRSIAVHPYMVKDRVYTAKVLASLLGIPAREIYSTISSKENYAYIIRKATDEQCDRVAAWKSSLVASKVDDALPGIIVEKEDHGKRFYPKGRLAAHLLGIANVDGVGLDGIEATYNSTLAGEDGEEIHSVDVLGVTVPIAPVIKKQTKPGSDVVLTIDESIQYVVETELDKQVKDFHAKGGICMVMDVKTAEILALAISPGFDPEKFDQLPQGLRRNRAVTDPYEPGSVFKCFLAGAALQNGYEPTSQVYCPGQMYVDGWPICNADDGFGAAGSESLADIIAFSFNTGTANAALALGREVYGKQLEAFGFGKVTDCGLPGEAEGLISDYHDWAKITTATVSFGQGVAVTPIQLCSAMQAVANKGVRMKPSIVRWIADNDGKVVKSTVPTVLGRPMSEAASRKLIDILTGVVSYGTGKRARVPGYLVAGKTGTAQVSANGVYADGHYIAGFLGVAPADDPRIVVLVKIEEPTPVYYGGLVAGPVFSRVCSKILPGLGVPPKAGFKQVGPNG